MSKPTKVPGIPKPPASVDRNTAGLLTNLIEAVEIRLGRRGDPKDRAVTLRELIDSGLAKDFKASPWDPNNPNSGNRGFGPNEIVDTAIPPVPTNFSVAPAYSQNILSWDYPRYSNHSFSEIYGHDSDVIGDAQLIGVSTGRVYIDPVGSGVSRYYWIRHVSQSSVLGPFNSGTGTLGQTALNVDMLLDELEASIPAVAFAAGLEPISVVSTLPAVSGYTGPSIVLLSTDGKLYRFVDGAWTAAVPTVDLTGTIASLQIADDAVTNAKIAIDAIQGDVIAAGAITETTIAADAVTNAKIAIDAIQGDVIAAGAITETTIAADAVTNAKIAIDAVRANVIEAGAITSAKIAADAITATKLADDAVTNSKIAVDAIQANVIEAGAITETKIGDSAITTAKIDANAITAAKIDAGAVTATEIASNAITSAKIDAGAVTASEIASNAITAVKIDAGAITTAKIDANAITAAKIDAGAVTATEIASNAITSAKIDAGAVTASEIASNAITAVKIDANAITSAKIDTGAVTATEIASNAITSVKINAGAVTASEIASNAITAVKIDANAITSAKIDTGAVTATEIASNAITSVKINAGAVTASEIASNAITAVKINAGAITANKIATDAVTADSIEAGAITAGAIAAGAINATNIIADNMILADAIASNAITAAKIQAGAIGASEIAAGVITSGKIAANTIEASKLKIDSNFLAESGTGELMLKTVSSNDGSGVKYENLSFDAVGVIAQTLQSGNLTMSNQSFAPTAFTLSTPWSEYTSINPYNQTGSTTTLPLLVDIFIPASQLKESGTYYIDFGAQPFGSISNSSSTSASMIVLDVLRKPPSSSTYSYVTSRRGTLTQNGSLPLAYRNGAADVSLTQSYDYHLKLFGYIKGFSNSASSSTMGMYGGFIRVFKIHKST